VLNDETGLVALYFDSNRAGGPGPVTDDAANNGNDIYAATLGPDETFGNTMQVGPIVNGAANDAGPALSFEPTGLYFQSNRLGVLGAFDLLVSTRTKLKGCPDRQKEQ